MENAYKIIKEDLVKTHYICQMNSNMNENFKMQ